MPDDPHTESLSFTEAGVIIDVHPVSMNEGSFLVLATTDRGTVDVCVTEGFEQACDGIDRWLDENVPADHPGRFKGYRLTKFDHETRMVREDVYPTRGALLKWFDDGVTPALEEVVVLAEFAGDHLLLLKDNDGNVLLDRRELVKDRIAEIYKDSGLMSVIADLSEYDIFADIPVPVR